jgi:manganese efflux pump family protein
MGIISILLIAVGLAMDAFAVSIAGGAAYKQLKIRHSLQMAGFFGGFQAIMPIIGALAGRSFKNYITGYDHWIAFLLLTAIGGKMVYESFKIKEAQKNYSPSDIFVLLALSVATSIDALAVGITLTLISADIVLAATLIGVVTFILSLFGVWLGKKFGHLFENKIETLGGLILIGLGLKILLQHTLF